MTEKRPRLPKGNMFMPDTTIEELRDIYKNAGTILRMLAYIKRKEYHTPLYGAGCEAIGA
ncbi:MAG: hypothetical protein F4Y82_05965 [Cenarchaeum sp. SB0665_bin_23]|nr:hypothetical protein [Cenarchaeum sp. SB0665_bin_23]MXZ94124.1 hypothetical protein [Cenarchaeum sp. SB0666_bin_15]MYC79577.1 hypothetical protein [Cenarchaeum sp. SB0661_bin_35]MYG32915.1 hypothetical protein [Cenarchaeum sp. SB0677_bin_16]